MKLFVPNENLFKDAVIRKVSKNDIKDSKNRFLFEWRKLKNETIYKISFKNEQKILGLLSLLGFPEELRIHIDLIETAKENTGKAKEVERIAGCLIAFACKIAFEKGYGGFVSLIPKTVLIDHYIGYYGFKRYGDQLAIDWDESRDLINKYLNDETK